MLSQEEFGSQQEVQEPFYGTQESLSQEDSRTFKALDSVNVLNKTGRQVILCPDGRRVLLVKGDSNIVYAIDANCYHQNGNLSEGTLHDRNIEDLGHAMCIECPAHHKLFSLATGEEVVVHSTKSPVRRYKALGVKQRTHAVRIADDGSVWVTPGVFPKSAECAVTKEILCSGINDGAKRKFSELVMDTDFDSADYPPVLSDLLAFSDPNETKHRGIRFTDNIRPQFSESAYPRVAAENPHGVKVPKLQGRWDM
eukprot:Rmarinus@m.12628